MLTELSEDTCIGIFEPEQDREIDSYIHKVKRVMWDAEAENPHLCVISADLEENFENV